VLSGNEVERLKSLRGKLAVLCPETDGLQAKHRIKRILKGKTREERVEELVDKVANEKLTFDSSYKDAKLVSQIFIYEPFSPMEVLEILCKNRYR
jgi:hypothetical protein